MDSSDRVIPPAPAALPAAAADGVMLALADGTGGRLRLEAAEGLKALTRQPHLLCHAAYVIDRLGFVAGAERGLVRQAREVRHFDVAELFAFAAPAQFATPTPQGLARALGLTAEDDPIALLRRIADTLLTRLASPAYPHLRETAEVAGFLRRANWPWAPVVIDAVARSGGRLDSSGFATGLNVWDRLEEWEDDGPVPPGSHHAVGAEEASEFLGSLLGPDAEERPAQRSYAAAAAGAFAPRQSPHENHILLAEAGTGLGKTLGYLAPAWLWAKRNGAPVWISTYTKNLQRQLEQETQRILPEPAERAERIIVRKGRENYLCLLNMQEAFARLSSQNPRSALMAGLIARWARHTRDGDMGGGDFPAWLMSLFSDPDLPEARQLTPLTLGLTDRRGECIYSACPHYRKCFIEKVGRSARKARLVIANHALVLTQLAVDTALGEAASNEEQAAAGGVRRLVFDEGHHLFDAADSAFSGLLSGLETSELRRWLRGPETQGRRGRCLRDRLGDLLDGDDKAEALVNQVLAAARCLAGPGWLRRIQAGQPEGAAEIFLSAVRAQVLARAEANMGASLETDCRPLGDGVAEAAGTLAGELIDLKRPMLQLAQRLLSRLDDEAAELNSTERARIEALARSLRRRAEMMAGGWIDMLSRLLEPQDVMFCDWFAVDQPGGRETDTGLHSHWIDPSVPLANAVLRQADGVIVTSATLKDRPPDLPDDWRNAEMRTGAVHLPYPVARISFESPYDYAARARILVVTDVNREDMDQVAAAYRELFLAAGGGALGLFTAIARLKAVYKRLATPLAKAGLPLYAQHVDPIDAGTLVDMFRAERDACLLGTDAVRDGVDVPGESLRLIVLDRVPWGQPTILERARRAAFGQALWQDMTVRLRLRQGFGRLIRRASDRGVFVILDPRLASRFATAFPDGVKIERMGLADARDAVASFLTACPEPPAAPSSGSEKVRKQGKATP